MSKHTPGPWSVSGGPTKIGKDWQSGQSIEYCGTINPQETTRYRGSICTLQSAYHIDGIRPSEAEANARLIAASPDLLEACDRAWILSEQALNGGKPIPSFQLAELRDLAKAAIAKAEGSNQ